MSLASWMILWKFVLIAGVILFAALAVSVTIGGFVDIRHLFSNLRRQHAQQQAEDESGDVVS